MAYRPSPSFKTAAEYRKTHHTESDTFDKVYPDEINQGAKVLAAWAYNVAMLPEILPRIPSRPSPGCSIARSSVNPAMRNRDRKSSKCHLSPGPKLPPRRVNECGKLSEIACFFDGATCLTKATLIVYK